MNERAALFSRLEQELLRLIEAGEGDFNDLALQLYGFQRRFNQPYRQFCEYRGGSGRLDDWEQIPPVPQQAFKLSRLAVFPEEETWREFRTSGTTGEGFGSHFLSSLRLYDAAIDAGWQRAGIPRENVFLLTPPPSEAPHSSLSYMFDRLAGSKEACSYFRGGKLQTERLRTDVAKSAEPVLILGTALALLNLTESSPEPLPLPGGSMLVETGGYKGSGRVLDKADLYGILSNYFSLPTDRFANEYGMTELSSQFYARGVDGPHRAGPWIRHRIIDPETGRKVGAGECGVLQLFDLANLGSNLAVQTEDLAIEQEDGFLLLGRDPAATARGCSRSADELLQA